MDQKQILELALETLNRQKTEIDEEIAAIQAELGTRAAFRQTESTPTGKRRGRKRTAAERKAQAQRMREYWAKRRTRKAKPAPASKPAARAKIRSMTAAQKNALSIKMREVWKRRKAAAKAKAK